MADETRTPSGQGEQGDRSVLSDIGDIGAEFVAAVRDGAAGLLDEQRQHAANELNALGEALRRSVQSLNQAGTDTVTQYSEQAIGHIDDIADALRQRTWSELAGDLDNFARRWPVAFVASAAGLGFVACRFLASPATRPPEATIPPALPRREVAPRALGSASGSDAKSGYPAATTGPAATIGKSG